MNKNLLLSLIIITAFYTGNIRPLNVNSWSIGIGKKTLLCSWKNNKMGDTATVKLDKLKPGDSLFVQEYWCGYNCINSTTTLSIRDGKGNLVKQSTQKNRHLGPYGSMKLETILTAPGFSKGEVFDIFMDVEMGKKKYANRLIGRIRVE